MNRNRRAEVHSLAARISECKDLLQNVIDEEQDYYDNIPENLQSSIRASDSEDCLNMMNEALEKLEEAIDDLEDV